MQAAATCSIVATALRKHFTRIQQGELHILHLTEANCWVVSCSWNVCGGCSYAYCMYRPTAPAAASACMVTHFSHVFRGSGLPARLQ